MKKIYAIMILLMGSQTIQAAPEGPYHNPEIILAQIHQSKHIGEGVYDAFCVNCHAKDPVISMGAPRSQVPEDWTLRLKKGMKVMMKNVAEGLNNMPPRGGCFECTDKDLKLATEYMLKKNS